MLVTGLGSEDGVQGSGFRNRKVQFTEVSVPISSDKRLLILVVAYNAEKTIGSVLTRIPMDRLPANTDVLVLDDSSSDNTFNEARRQSESSGSLTVKVLFNPVNQGYGGNQKLGYQYAVRNGYDAVVLLHGDGQYAPEKLPDIAGPVLSGEADACFGSRMIDEGGARRGGMPLYKYVGNRILSSFQNKVLGAGLSEYHSGYRAYSLAALRRIPFQRNSNDFHFDTEIIIQLLAGNMKIREVPIPTYYGDEICHVNGLKYAWNVFRATILYAAHKINILYQPQYDVGTGDTVYTLKDGFVSSHSLAIDAVPAGSRVLDVAGGAGYVAAKLRARGCHVTGIDRTEFRTHHYDEFLCCDVGCGRLPDGLAMYDVILLLDCLEHFTEPEALLAALRSRLYRPGVKVIVSVPNIGFFVTRLALLAGQFNYGKKGILDKTHTRLFTFSSITRMLVQEGFRVEKVLGVPAPFPVALKGRTGSILLNTNRLLIYVWKRMFAYQAYIEATIVPPVDSLLEKTISHSRDLAGGS